MELDRSFPFLFDISADRWGGGLLVWGGEGGARLGRRGADSKGMGMCGPRLTSPWELDRRLRPAERGASRMVALVRFGAGRRGDAEGKDTVLLSSTERGGSSGLVLRGCVGGRSDCGGRIILG